jgi:hypothetical protein
MKRCFMSQIVTTSQKSLIDNPKLISNESKHITLVNHLTTKLDCNNVRKTTIKLIQNYELDIVTYCL